MGFNNPAEALTWVYAAVAYSLMRPPRIFVRVIHRIANGTGGTRVTVAGGRRIVVHAADGTELWRTDTAPSTITGLTWIRGGREVAASACGGVYRFAPHSTAPTGHLAYPGSHLAVAATPDNKWICTGNQDRTVHIWRTRDASELEMAGYPDKVTRLGFDPADWYLANNGAADVTVWDFSGKGPGGTSPRQLRGHDSVTDLAWQTAPAPKEACACGSRRPVSRDAVGVRGSGSISARLSLLSPGWTPIGSSA